MKIYTKTGDQGMTSLIGGRRVFKTDVRVEAYGTVDELSAFVALLTDRIRPDRRLSRCTEWLDGIASRLMTLAALLALDRESDAAANLPPLPEQAVADLETAIDRMHEELPPIDKFTLPGGAEAVSLCHVCRTVCRRAERAALRADAEYGVAPEALRYLNRLSDFFYALGRYIGHKLEVEEILWIP